MAQDYLKRPSGRFLILLSFLFSILILSSLFALIFASKPNSGKIALRDGIAPGHAVTVLEVVPNGFKILDPYGQVKTLAKDSITDYKLCVRENPRF